MYKRWINIGILIPGIGMVLFLVIFLLAFPVFNNKDDSQPKHGNSVLSHPPVIHEKVFFCGEKVPIEFFDIYESLDRELLINTFFHSQSMLFVKRANRFFPVIEPTLAEYDIPNDFKYLAIAESGLSHAVSPSGATGIWQLLEGTAKDYGLEVNEEVDERYHIEKASVAACKFLRDSYKIYNNWAMVAASYNVGRRGVNRQIDRQGENEYFNLVFNEETARYLFRIIAIKLVMKNPQHYGFNIPKIDLYKPFSYSEITISGKIDDVGTFARDNGTNYKVFKILNPWLRDNKLSNPKAKEYIIKIPKSRGR